MESKERILKAAIELMTEKGEITIREVTERAGVNVASINYYFGNKNNLLKVIEEHFSNILFDFQQSFLGDENATPKQKIINWALGLMEYMIKYPAIIPLIVSLVNDDKKYSPAIVEKIYMNVDIMKNICMLIALETGIYDEKIIGFKYTQIFSGIVGPIINEVLNNLYNQKLPSQLNTKEIRREYVENLVETILK
ncbi:MAG: TetR/AcrR family transcriptional regulator [Clostridium sp.]